MIRILLCRYTVMGHGTLSQPARINGEVHWQFTVLSSIDGAFHICDNDFDGCKEVPLPHTYKLHIDEIFIPNRRNILGGIQISVLNHEAVSFRVAASSPDLEIDVILQAVQNGGMQEIAKCSGKGEVYWPYVRLEATQDHKQSFLNKTSASHSNLLTGTREGHMSSRSLKTPKIPKTLGGGKSKSASKLKSIIPDPKLYFIEVVAPQGWPITLQQWRRVDEIRNSNEFIKIESLINKKITKEKPTSAKEKDKDKENNQPATMHQPDDAYIVIECALAIGGGAHAKRDDNRDLELAAAIKSWDVREPGRNIRGAQIRKDFRNEFLEVLPLPTSESVHTVTEEYLAEEIGEEDRKECIQQFPQGPTPASESIIMEMTVESVEEAKYLTMPDQLKDKFMPLYFIPFCTKEKNDNMSVLVTPDISEAAKKNRHARIEAALDRMRELQLFNEEFVLGRQRKRCQLLEKLFVDSQWTADLTEVLEARDEVIAQETLSRSISASKKKQEAKKK